MKIKEIILQGSERFPMVFGNDEMPMMYPNLYLLIMSRKRDAVNTMKAKCRAIIRLYDFCESNNIDIESNFKSGNLLNNQQIESLCEFLHEKYVAIEHKKKNVDKNKNNYKVISLNFKLPKNKKKYVSNNTFNIMLNYVIHYLDWLSDYNMEQMSREGLSYDTKINARKKMIKYLKNSALRSKKQVEVKGLADGIEKIITNALDPGNENNPFQDEFVKVRNQFFVMLSLATGLRRGEMLKIKTNHFDPATKSLKVIRNPDDALDTRSTEGNVKTRSRILEVRDELYKMYVQYINSRSKIRKALTHPYLFVTKYGNPLSYSSAGELYATLKKNFPDLANEKITQHTLRHHWNYKFSIYMKSKNMSDSEIDTYRKFIMGWSETSKMPDLYNNKFIIEQANKQNVLYQASIFEISNNVKEDKDEK